MHILLVLKTLSTGSWTPTHKTLHFLFARSLIQTGWTMAHPPLQRPAPHYCTPLTPHTTLPSFHFRTSVNHREELQPDMRRCCWYCWSKKVQSNPKNHLPALDQAPRLSSNGYMSNQGPVSPLWLATLQNPGLFSRFSFCIIQGKSDLGKKR